MHVMHKGWFTFLAIQKLRNTTCREFIIPSIDFETIMDKYMYFLPHVQLQNPEMRQLFTNPEAMRAMMQIQQGMATLQQTAPGLLRPGGYVSCDVHVTLIIKDLWIIEKSSIVHYLQ